MNDGPLTRFEVACLAVSFATSAAVFISFVWFAVNLATQLI